MTAIAADFSQILICRILAVSAAILRVAADSAATIIVRAFVVFVRHKTFTPLTLKILPLFDNA